MYKYELYNRAYTSSVMMKIIVMNVTSAHFVCVWHKIFTLQILLLKSTIALAKVALLRYATCVIKSISPIMNLTRDDLTVPLLIIHCFISKILAQI